MTGCGGVASPKAFTLDFRSLKVVERIEYISEAAKVRELSESEATEVLLYMALAASPHAMEPAGMRAALKQQSKTSSSQPTLRLPPNSLSLPD